MRRLENRTTYRIIGTLGAYDVTMQRIKNDRNGNPRYEVMISSTDEIAKRYRSQTYVYHMQGHYDNEAGEAREAVREHEARLYKED